MKLFLWSALAVVGASVGLACSSSSGGGGGVPCDEAGACPVGSNTECQQGVCVPIASGGAGGGPAGGAGGLPSGGAGGLPSGGGGGIGGGAGGMPPGGGGGPSGGSGGVPPGGGGGSSGTGGGSSACTSTTQGLPCNQVWDTTSACGQCVVSNCCNETNACFNSKECSGLFECILAFDCANATDPNTCISQNCSDCATSTAITQFNAVNNCANNKCATSCP